MVNLIGKRSNSHPGHRSSMAAARPMPAPRLHGWPPAAVNCRAASCMH